MNARGKAKMEPIPWPDIKERRKAGLSEYDQERKSWRTCGITIYGKNVIPQIGEQVWLADHD